jgi:hypothetical protein
MLVLALFRFQLERLKLNDVSSEELEVVASFKEPLPGSNVSGVVVPVLQVRLGSLNREKRIKGCRNPFRIGLRASYGKVAVEMQPLDRKPLGTS